MFLGEFFLQHEISSYDLLQKKDSVYLDHAGECRPTEWILNLYRILNSEVIWNGIRLGVATRH
jgi:adenosine deaminase